MSTKKKGRKLAVDMNNHGQNQNPKPHTSNQRASTKLYSSTTYGTMSSSSSSSSLISKVHNGRGTCNPLLEGGLRHGEGRLPVAKCNQPPPDCASQLVSHRNRFSKTKQRAGDDDAVGTENFLCFTSRSPGGTKKPTPSFRPPTSKPESGH